MKVAQPGDRADVTFVTPDGYTPTGVHFLENGQWSELPDRTHIDAQTHDAIVNVQDGGAGDAPAAADGVINDTSGPSETAPPEPTTTTEPPTTTAPPPTTTTTPKAADKDGVAAATENAAPNGGDNNQDGIPDSEQPNVVSVPAAVDVNGNGALDDYVTIVSPTGTTIENARALKVPTDPAPPKDVEFGYGLFDYDVKVAKSGDAADVKFILPDGAAASTNVFMLQNGKWTEVTQHADIDTASNEVTVGLKDGGVGDADSKSNGVIDDPIGIAQPEVPPPASDLLHVRGQRIDNLSEPGISFVYQLFDCGTGAANPPPPVLWCRGPTSPSLVDGTEFTFNGLTSGHWYRAQQSTVAGWPLTGITCLGGLDRNNQDIAGRTGAVRVDSTATAGAACTFTNGQPGTVMLIKQTTPDGSPKVFSAILRRCGSTTGSTCNTGSSQVGQTQSLSDNQSVNWTLTQNGRYFLDEGDVPGWTLSTRTCTGDTTGGGNPANNGNGGLNFFIADFTTQAVVCTFTNTQTQPANNTITIRKATVPTPSTQPFTFVVVQCTGTGSTITGTVIAANQCDNESTPVPPSTATGFPVTDNDFVTLALSDTSDRWYRITETLPSGWTITGRDCTGGVNESTGNPAQATSYYVAVGSTGGQIDCTFTNTAGNSGNGSIIVHKGGLRGTDRGRPQHLRVGPRRRDLPVLDGPDHLDRHVHDRRQRQLHVRPAPRGRLLRP